MYCGNKNAAKNLFYNYECICTVSRELARADINSVVAPVPDGDNYAWAIAKVMFNSLSGKFGNLWYKLYYSPFVHQGFKGCSL